MRRSARSKKSSRRSVRSRKSVRRRSVRSKKSKKSSKKKSKKSSKKSKKKYSEEEKLIIKELNKILSKVNFNTTNFKFIKEKLKTELNIEISLYKQFIKDEINNWILKKISAEISKVIKKKDIETFTLKELINHLEKKLKMNLNDLRKYIKDEIRMQL